MRFCAGVYDECLRVIDRNGDYLWGDVFPTVRKVKTNAQDMLIDLGTPKRFTTFSLAQSAQGTQERFVQRNYCCIVMTCVQRYMFKLSRGGAHG